MDFNDSNCEAAFRAKAQSWLEANIPTKDELSALDELGESAALAEAKVGCGLGLHPLAGRLWWGRWKCNGGGDL